MYINTFYLYCTLHERNLKVCQEKHKKRQLNTVHVYTGSLGTVQFVGVYMGTLHKGYHFSTFFVEERTTLKREGSGNVATSKALIGSQIFWWRVRETYRETTNSTLPGLFANTAKPFLSQTKSEVQTFLPLATDDRLIGNLTSI